MSKLILSEPQIPSTYGLEIHRQELLHADYSSTYRSTENELTPQLTPENQKRARIDTSETPSELAEIVAAWITLPDHIRAAIMALVRTQGKG